MEREDGIVMATNEMSLPYEYHSVTHLPRTWVSLGLDLVFSYFENGLCALGSFPKGLRREKQRAVCRGDGKFLGAKAGKTKKETNFPGQSLETGWKYSL